MEMTDSKTKAKELLTLGNYPSKTDKVYEILLDSIVTRKFSPGKRLVERELANQLGVSKTPVREALGKLEREGLVEIEHDQGAFVTKLSKEDIMEIYDLREVIEGLAARRVAERASKEQIKQLKSFIQSMEKCLDRDDLNCYSGFDIKFHNLLAEISGNKRLYKIMQNLRDQTRLLMSSTVKLPGRAEESLIEHKSLIKAISQQDAETAGMEAKKHIRQVQQSLKELTNFLRHRR